MTQSFTRHQLFPNLKVLHILLTGGVLLMMGLAGCSGEAENAQRSQNLPGLEVSLTGVEVRNLPIFIEASGSLLADETVTVSAKVAGRVMEVTRDLRDVVEPGQVLVKIDPTDYRLMLQEKTYAMNQALAQLGLSEMPQGEVDTTRLPTVQPCRQAP